MSPETGHGTGGGPPSGSGVIRRDQHYARYAYRVVAKVVSGNDYKVAINDFGANILQSGLLAAIAALQRERDSQGGVVLEHLAGVGLPGIGQVKAKDLPERVRELDTDTYMMVTREALRLTAWLKRAAEASFGAD